MKHLAARVAVTTGEHQHAYIYLASMLVQARIAERPIARLAPQLHQVALDELADLLTPWLLRYFTYEEVDAEQD